MGRCAICPTVEDPGPVIARLRAAGCVYAEDEAALIILAARTPDELETMLEQRTAGRPLEHVVGWAEFRGLRIAVEPGVFVPRRRSEFLVGQALALVPARSIAVVVDLCCGAGALGLALAAAAGPIELHAAELDPLAVRCARRNVEPAGGRVYEGDLFEPLPGELRGRVDILMANVPYVPTGEIDLLPAEARLHEPTAALDGGTDGLDVLRRVASAAPGWLAPGGHLLIETSERQVQPALDAFVDCGLLARVAEDEALGASVIIGTRP